jgi:hypothetical protein
MITTIIAAVMCALAGVGAALDFADTLRNGGGYSSTAQRVTGLVISGMGVLFCVTTGVWLGVAALA